MRPASLKMSRLLAASSGAVLGSSSDLTQRIVRLKADAPWVDPSNPYSPGEWHTNSISASPSSCSPGTTVTLSWDFSRGPARKIESMYIDFGVVNAHGGDTLRTHNMLAFVSGLKLTLNGSLVKEYTSNLDLRMLHAAHLLTRHSTDALYHSLAEIRAATGAYDQGTLSAMDFPPAATTACSIPVYQLFPWLNNTTVGTGPIRSIKIELSFRPGFAAQQADNVDFINATSNADLYASSITFRDIALRAEMSAIQSPSLLQLPSRVLFPVSFFHKKSYVLDLTATGTSQIIRLAEALPRSNPIVRTWAILRDTGACTTWNDADGGSVLRTGPEWLGFSLKKTGSSNEVVCDTRAKATRWFLRQHRMATGRAAPPILYDGSSNLGSTWAAVPLIDWRALYCDNDETYSDSQETFLYGGVNTRRDDYELTVSNLAAMSAACELWIVNETVELGLIAADGQYARMEHAA